MRGASNPYYLSATTATTTSPTGADRSSIAATLISFEDESGTISGTANPRRTPRPVGTCWRTPATIVIAVVTDNRVVDVGVVHRHVGCLVHAQACSSVAAPGRIRRLLRIECPSASLAKDDSACFAALSKTYTDGRLETEVHNIPWSALDLLRRGRLLHHPIFVDRLRHLSDDDFVPLHPYAAAELQQRSRQAFCLRFGQVSRPSAHEADNAVTIIRIAAHAHRAVLAAFAREETDIMLAFSKLERLLKLISVETLMASLRRGNVLHAGADLHAGGGCAASCVRAVVASLLVAVSSLSPHACGAGGQESSDHEQCRGPN